MTQATPIIGANQSGLSYRNQDNDGKRALLNHHKGATAPTYAEAGMVWLDDSATPWLMKVYDGTDWMVVSSINATTNEVIPYRAGAALGSAATRAGGTAGAALPSMDELASEGFYARNLLFNGGFLTAQRGTVISSTSIPANNDDTYTLDRWCLLSELNNTADVAQDVTNMPTGSAACVSLTLKTANKKVGLAQFVEARHAVRAMGGVVSLSFKAKKGAGNITAGKIRAAVMSWTGMADAVTSDVVSVWNAEGTNPTLASGWTYENTPADIVLTSGYQTVKIENIAIDTSGAKNIGVFIWVDNQNGTVSDVVYIADVQLQLGANATAFEALPHAVSELHCKRYFQRAQSVSGTPCVMGQGVATATTVSRFMVPTQARLRTDPSVTCAGLTAYGNGTSVALATADVSAGQVGENGVTVSFSKGGFTANYNYTLMLATGSANYLDLDAEL